MEGHWGRGVEVTQSGGCVQEIRRGVWRDAKIAIGSRGVIGREQFLVGLCEL